MKKKCYKCNLNFSIDKFSKNKSKKDELGSMCKKCWNDYYKHIYYLNGNEKSRLKINNKKRSEYIHRIVKEAKNKPCFDCGIIYPYYVMDFDHIRDKKFLVSNAVNIKCSIKIILEEIKKCEVVCSNCHRIRTFKRSKNSG